MEQSVFDGGANPAVFSGFPVLGSEQVVRLGRNTLNTRLFGRYALIGMVGLAIDFGLFLLLMALGVVPILANVASSVVAITNNYVLNSTLNFKNKVGLLPGLRFFSVGFAGLTLATVFLHFLMASDISPVVGKAIVLPAVLVAQFFGNKAWTFGEGKPKSNGSR